MKAIALVLAAGLVAVPADRLAAQDSFPTRPPGPTPLAPVRFPQFQELTLPNGMTLLVVENHEQPVVSVNLNFRAGAIYDADGKEGTAELVAQLLTKGTPTRTADEIAATIEGVGGSLSASSGDDFLTVSADVLSDHADLAFDLLGDAVRRATFPSDELELARTQALSGLALQLSQPDIVADRVFKKEVYGRHPYGRSATQESYKAIMQDDVKHFAASRIRPGRALLVIAGDVTVARARALAQKAFGGWTGAPAVAAVPPTPPVKTTTDILLVHRPGSVQGNIVIGNTTSLPTDPGYYAARIATQVLGGGADARLFLILREQKSWTYGAYADLQRYRGLGHWRATAEVRTEVTDSALTELLRQIDRIRTEAIPDSELGNAKGFLVGSFPLSIETPRQIAAQVSTVKLLGLGTAYLSRYRERLNAVTPERARAAAARTYRRHALTIVVVGDAAKLSDQLGAIAPVRLVDIDGKPLAPADLTPPAAGPLALDRAQIAARTDSFRVTFQGNPIGAVVATVRQTPDSLVYTEQSALGGFAQRTTVVLDPADLSVKQTNQTTTAGGRTTEVHLRYAGGRVSGGGTDPQPGGAPKTYTVDTTLAPGTYDDNVVNLIVPALGLTPGKTFHVTLFSTGEGTAKPYTFKVGTPESVTVPAGTFQAYRIEVTGSQSPFVIHVTTEAPRRVVRTEIVGQPVVFELVK